MLRIVSLGAGVQSTTMALLAAHQDITPMPDCAIFADTQSEPAAVYRHIAWLESKLPFPIYTVTAGSLRAHILNAMAGLNRMDGRPPFFTKGGGMLRRQCTGDFKLAPIQRKIRELIGLSPRQRGPRTPIVELWIGISTDETIRVKPSRYPYVIHRWPLLELKKSRADCLRWNRARGYPRPPKSACTFCPYSDDARLYEIKAFDPASFADAVEVDRVIRPGIPGRNRPVDEQWFVHRSRRPLDEVNLSPIDMCGTVTMFSDECEGVCGV